MLNNCANQLIHCHIYNFPSELLCIVISIFDHVGLTNIEVANVARHNNPTTLHNKCRCKVLRHLSRCRHEHSWHSIYLYKVTNLCRR